MTKHMLRVSKEDLKNYDAIVALDMDGVVSDTYLNILRHKHPALKDKRTTDFIENNPHYFKAKEGELRRLTPHDVRGVMVDSLSLLLAIAKETNIGFVLVSSWIRTKETCLAVEDMFLQLTGMEFNKPLIIGQSNGYGGECREEDFFDLIRNYTDKNHPSLVMAIDDSNPHFPILGSIGSFVSPIGRNGFVMDDYIRCLRKMNFNDDNWYTWCEHGYLDNVETPRFNKEDLWKNIHNNNLKLMEMALGH